MGSVRGHWSERAVDAIRQQCISHDFYKKTVWRAFNSIDVCCPGEVVLIVGPTRVGKSRAIADVRDLLVGPQDRLGDGQMPFVTVTAGNQSTRGQFSTLSLFVDGLRAMQHPVYGVAHNDDPWGEKRLRLLLRTPERLLTDAFKTALKMRGTRFLAIDEAHHVQYAPGAAGTEAAILDSWKCLAQQTGLILVLVGDYSLRGMLRESTHMLGRSRSIEFPRYNGSRPTESETFHRVLKTFSECINFYKSESLCTWHDLMMEGSLGCVGQLSRWLRDALGQTREEKSPVLSLRHLQESIQSRNDLACFAEKILHGEEPKEHEGQVVAGGRPVRAVRGAGSNDKRRPFQARPRRHRRNGRA